MIRVIRDFTVPEPDTQYLVQHRIAFAEDWVTIHTASASLDCVTWLEETRLVRQLMGLTGHPGGVFQ